jgi:hypothetical protein
MRPRPRVRPPPTLLIDGLRNSTATLALRAAMLALATTSVPSLAARPPVAMIELGRQQIVTFEPTVRSLQQFRGSRLLWTLPA